MRCVCRKNPSVMMGTISKVGNMRANPTQIFVHPAMQPTNFGFIVKSPGHARLISDDKDVPASIVAPLNCLAGAFDPAKILDAMGIARVMIEHAVAIKEHG